MRILIFVEYPYFDLETARELLPWLRDRLIQLRKIKNEIELLLVNGDKYALQQYASETKKIIDEIISKGIILRDIDIGLVDFPAIINNKPAFFCWKIDENDIAYWHYMDEGFRGRKRLTGYEDILSLR
ncbi:Conserved hypothetical protein [Saccharolobus solfataricus P2]|uniref:DUF2203 family protein n=2 Tax=Saccharolobus solfataricus TaxID=2287 RepID=Q7LX55_SACS2|nr:Conserved hypothetical protein [Saccharolobus solfataricus P2]CAA69427.1 orf c01025 [Saccharolobus solfataricus P2]SAI85844.1 uncharacterised protein [Saccharolobus solfataricus]